MRPLAGPSYNALPANRLGKWFTLPSMSCGDLTGAGAAPGVSYLPIRRAAVCSGPSCWPGASVFLCYCLALLAFWATRADALVELPDALIFLQAAGCAGGAAPVCGNGCPVLAVPTCGFFRRKC